MTGTDPTPETTLDLLRRLVQIPSPYFEEQDCAEFVYDWLAEREFNPAYHHVSEPDITEFDGKNVIARQEGTDPDGPTLLLSAHMDTVKIAENWDEDPFSGRIEDGKLYGQGACDMKAGLAAAMSAFEALSQCNLTGDLLFTGVVGEEGPYGLGTDQLIRDGYTDHVDMAVVTEPGPLLAQTDIENPALLLGARGRVLYDVSIRGEAAHGSQPTKGKNAVAEAGRIITALGELDVGSHPKLGTGSVCPLLAEGGSETLSVPERARVMVDRHIVVGETEETALAEGEAAIDALDLDCDIEIDSQEKPTPDTNYRPYVTNASHPLVSAFERAATVVTGQEPTLGYCASIGDFNYLGDRADIPTVIVGPDGGNIHSSGEFVYTEDVCDVTAMLVEAGRELLS